MTRLVVRVSRDAAIANVAAGPSMPSHRKMPFVASNGGMRFSRSNEAMTGLHGLLVAHDLTATPLTTAITALGAPATITEDAPLQGNLNLNRYFYISGRIGTEFQEIAAKAAAIPGVDAAYIKPPAEVMRLRPPSARTCGSAENVVATYCGVPAPEGIDIAAARSRPGGDGTGIRLVDVEGDWNNRHEVLTGRLVQTLSTGAVADADWGSDREDWTNHGTAVLSILCASGGNRRQLDGLCVGADFAAVSFFQTPAEDADTASAILQAADRLRPGDVLLLEAHRSGPRFNFQGRIDELGYIPIEWWDDDAAAIRSATERGIIVIEAGGNGAENLNGSTYDTPGPGFPRDWKNPFRRGAADTGAIIIGAGAAPGAEVPRSRLGFSNYGDCCDVQAWGEQILAAGYGRLGGGADENAWYTLFSGTSGAAPIVAATVACLQAIRRAAGKSVLIPAQVREGLRATGSPQIWASGASRDDPIGNQPDLKQLLAWSDTVSDHPVA